MPFGYRPGEPYEDYIGYLTPDEVLRLTRCLDSIDAPVIPPAETNFAPLYTIQDDKVTSSRLVDEVPPAHADDFLRVIRLAAQCRRGLLCRIE
ncbi:MAG: hypothetical protein PVS3B1_33650 [Ktedonobacteraceae bacterium]